MIVKLHPAITKLLVFGIWFDALTLGKIILVNRNHEDNKRLINHEKIHSRQYAELMERHGSLKGFLMFFVIYIDDFWMGYIRTNSFYGAYRRIRFEQEAWRFEYDLQYLDVRQPFAWEGMEI